MAADEFSTIKNRIVCRMVNAKRNAELLKNRPYTPIADLAVIYEIRISNSRNMTVPFTYDLMSTYNILIDNIHEAAIQNINPWIFDLYDYLSEFLPFDKSNGDRLTSYVITTNDRICGAAAVLRNEVMDQIAQIFPDGFYLIPSSAEEFIVCKKDESLKRDLNAVIQDAIVPELRLSGNVYEYDYATRGLTITAEHKEKESILDKLDRKKETVEERRSVPQQSKDRVIE